jgi:hypothetical protein
MADGFPIPAARVAAVIASVLDAQGDNHLAEVVRSASASIEETDYDNWNGGTYFHTLVLELPVADYARIEPALTSHEEKIAEKLRTALRGTGNMVLNSVMFKPAFEEEPALRTSRTSGDDEARIWGGAGFRLFLSHVSAHKVAVSSLKQHLARYGVRAFVAHEDIEPSLEWQTEIELALQTMHAMAALITPDFHSSNWTDQEIGIAVGRGLLVLPVRLPENPYGFIAKNQGLRGKLEDPAGLATNIVSILLRRLRTRESMCESLVVALEHANSFAMSRTVTDMLEEGTGFTLNQVDRLDAAILANNQVSDSFGVPERLRRLVAQVREDRKAESSPSRRT